MIKNIYIFGAGRVGLANATYLAIKDPESFVTVIDPDISLIRNLRAGIEPYGAPYFENLFPNKVSFLTNDEFGLDEDESEDYVLICFGVKNSISDYLNIFSLFPSAKCIIIRATIHPEVVISIKDSRVPNLDNIILFPEFLTEGQESSGVLNYDQTFLGSFADYTSFKEATDLFGIGNKVVQMNAMTAACVKIATNAALAFKVTLANVIDDSFGQYITDTNSITKYVERDPRIGKNYLRPGAGYGGSCLPYAMDLLHHDLAYKIRDYNTETRPFNIMQRISGGKILVFGYNFKNVKDFRNSNQLQIIHSLSVTDEVYVTDDYYDKIVQSWWIEDPMQIISSVTDIIIFYSTKKLIMLEDYLHGDPNPKDLEVWNSINKIDLR